MDIPDCRDAYVDANATLGPLQIDYLFIHYCTFEGYPVVSFAVLLLWLSALFFFLGSTADGYFSPTLASISEKLNIPYDIAGVTFLAFGNGAPDVFSSIAAYLNGVGETGINALLGGAMFVSTVVVGCVAIACSVKVQRWSFSRDIAALLVSLMLLLILARATTMSTSDNDGMVMLFLVAYVVYVGSVVLPECLSRFRAAKREVYVAQAAGLNPPGGVLSAFWHALSPRGNSTAITNGQSQQYSFITKQDAEHGEKNYELSSPRKKPAPTFTSDVYEDHFHDLTSDEPSLSSPLIAEEERDRELDAVSSSSSSSPHWIGYSSGGGVIASAYWRHLRWRWRLRRRVVQVFYGDETLLVKFLSIPQAFLVVIRDVTIPMLDQEAWSRSLATLSPVTAPLWVLFAIGYQHTYIHIGSSTSIPLWSIVTACGVIASVIVSYTTHRSRPPTSLWYSLFFLSLAFASCVCWIFTVANELMALLVAVGFITHASNSLLGLTVLSWGNSIGDLVTNVSVARAGFPEMAIAGCFGGPVFNVLLGLGVPMSYAYFKNQKVALDLDAHSKVSLGFLFVSLIMSYLVFRRHHFHCPPWYGQILVAYYAVYTIVNIAMAFRDFLILG